MRLKMTSVSATSSIHPFDNTNQLPKGGAVMMLKFL